MLAFDLRFPATMRYLLLMAAILLCSILPLQAQSQATVSTSAELAAAINAANSDADADTITLAADITLTAALPHIRSTIVIEGNDHSISGNGEFRIFYVEASGDLTINEATLRDGVAHTWIQWPGWPEAHLFAGAIYNEGKLTIANSEFSGNAASDGGAIVNFGDASVTISDSEFSDNSARDSGGAIFNWGDASLTISGSAFSGNSAGVSVGGAILNGGDASISDSQFSGNSAGFRGGAIFNEDDASIRISDSSFADNSPQDCGGVECVSETPSTEDEASSSGEVSTHAELAAAIDAANADPDSDTITLTADITLSAALPPITSSIVIEGDGHSISGNNRRRIFHVTAEGNLTINNANLRDGRARPAVQPPQYSAGQEFGGAIYSEGRVSISASEFSGNSAGGDGGAIYNWDGQVTISTSEFSGNSVEGSGGAIRNYSGEVAISASEFSDNSAAFGGAIENGGEITISDSHFEGNSAGDEGGAIRNWGEVTISGSVFSGNSAEGVGGGAIFNNYGEVAISASQFSGNSSSDRGGAIRNFVGEVTISASEFNGNSARYDGGAIFSRGGEVSIESSSFENNSASELNGNSARYDGGAIYNMGGAVNIESSSFADNSPQDCHGVVCGDAPDSGGQLLRSGQTVTGRVNDGNPDDEYVFEAAAGDIITIAMNKTSGDLDPLLRLLDADGDGLTSNDDGGADRNALISDFSAPYTGEYTIRATRYNGADGSSAGAYELTLTREQVSASDCSPAPRLQDRDRAVNMSGENLNGYAFEVTGDTVSDEGPMVLSVDPGEEISVLGAPICHDGSYWFFTGKCWPNASGNVRCQQGFVREGRGEQYFLQPVSGEQDDGVSISGEVSTSAELAAAINAANSDADADTITLAADITLTAALPHIRSTIVIEGNDHSISGNGEFRIFYVEASGDLTINNASLRDGIALPAQPPGYSNAYEIGGAIYNEGVLTIRDSVFSDNSAVEGGGAIFNWREASVSISESEFSDNSAAYGGAIDNSGELTISDSDFSGNSSVNQGGAIDNRGELTISDSNFSDNSAPQLGGAIDNSGELTISGSEFSGNSTRGGGGAIGNDRDASLTISDSDFSGNSARRGGAIRSHEDGTAVIETSSFANNSPEDCVGVECVSVAPPATEDEASSSGEVSTHAQLAAAINAANADAGSDTISLAADITLSEPLPHITSTIIIEGNEHSISGGGEFRIFHVEADGDLTINNATLRDGVGRPEIQPPDRSNAYEIGGAIYSEGWLAISDSEFSGNSADKFGGAIYSLSDASITISDSEFRGNSAGDVGGVIYNWGEISISRSEFSGNSALVGGAILNRGDARITISDSDFSDNAAGFHGGAISSTISSGDENPILTISDSRFINNSAGGGGAQFDDAGELMVTGFRVGNSPGFDGGAIENWGEASISGSHFTGNMARQGGGAIISAGVLSVSESHFRGNSSAEGGGALVNWQEATVIDSTFDGNVTNAEGGAIRNRGELGVSGSTLRDNTAGLEGGAIWNDDEFGTVTVESSSFENNSPEDCVGVECVSVAPPATDDEASSPITCGETVTGAISDENEQDYWAFEAQAGQTVKISMWNTDASGLDSRLLLSDAGGYVLGRSSGRGDAYLEATLDDAGTYTIEAARASESSSGAYRLYLECESAPDATGEVSTHAELAAAIDAANADVDADTITLAADITLSEPLPRITSAIVIEGHGYSISGAGEYRIFFVAASGDLTIRSAILRDGVARDAAGAIYSVGALTISDSIFTGNSTRGAAGAIVNGGELTIGGSEFSGNSAELAGAIGNGGELTISDSEFSGNSAVRGSGRGTGIGGAIFNWAGARLTVRDSRFRGNSAGDDDIDENGGAIYNEGESSIVDSEFSGNSAGWHGGAVANASGASLSISGAEFNENFSFRGGAIFIQEDATTSITSISSSVFSGNSARSGGAIYVRGNVHINVAESEFRGNSAPDENGVGGAILIEPASSINISDSEFRDNSAAETGGAIRNYGELSVSGSEFSGNSAIGGGAIYNDSSSGASITIRGSVFSGNSAEGGGAIVNRDDASISASQFSGNSATGYGGAIVNDVPGTASVSGSVFSGNSAGQGGGAIVNGEDATINESVFSGNTARSGGAIYNAVWSRLISISDSEFSDNSASEKGGAIYNWKELNISDSEFSGNSADEEGGAIYTDDDGTVTFESSSFSDNSPDDCYGVECVSVAPPATEDVASAPITCGDTVTSAITDENEQDYWSFEAQAGQTVKISMWNTDASGLDSRLLLSNAGGYVLGRSSGSGDSYLEATLEEAGTYTIEAARTSDSPAGAYLLYLQCESAPAATGEVRTSAELAAAIDDANGDAASDTITLAADITLSEPLPHITSAIVIEGADYSISGDDRFRPFFVEPEGALTLRNLVLRAGLASGENGDGGAVFNRGELTIEGGELRDNRAEDGGGAIYNWDGEVTIIRSEFSDNVASTDGGAIHNRSALSVANSVFSGNRAEDAGGALANYSGEAKVTNVDFSDNRAASWGGAIHSGSESDIEVSDSEFQGNDAGEGGGAIVSDGEAVLQDNSYEGNIPDDCLGENCFADGPLLDLPNERFLGIERIACTATDTYFILRLKTESLKDPAVLRLVQGSLEHYILEVNLATEGDARIAQVVPLPEADSYGQDINWQDWSELRFAAAQHVTSFMAETALKVKIGEGARIAIRGLEFIGQLSAWVDERYTREQSPLGLRLTWYNTSKEPTVDRYLLHATHSEGGGLTLSTSLGPMTLIAKAASVSSDVEETWPHNWLRSYIMEDLGVINLVPEELRYLAEFSPAATMSYYADRFFIDREGMASTAPQRVC